MSTNTQYTSQRVSQVNTGTENHTFGVIDKKGRLVGASVWFTTEVYEACERTPMQTFYYVKAGTYLTVEAHATRDGKFYGPFTNARAKFELLEGNELSVQLKITEWVEKYLKGAAGRAVKSFGLMGRG